MADDTTNTSTIPEAALNDQIAVNRTLPLIEPDTIPQEPDGYVPLSAEARQQGLRKVGDEEVAELEQAMECMVENASTLKADLGQYAPPPDKAKPIVEQLKLNRRSLNRARALVQYMEEREKILLHDAILYAENAKDAYDYHVKHKPQLKDRYKPLGKFFDARSRAISEGIAEAKKRKGEELKKEDELRTLMEELKQREAYLRKLEEDLKQREAALKPA